DMSVRAAVAAVADGRADAMVSAGATGAAVTAAVHGLGRLPGVRRPALAASLPAPGGPVVLLDVGARAEANAATMVEHAALAGGAPASAEVPHAAALLGVAGIVVICHGNARGGDLASGIALAARLHRIGAGARMAAELAEPTEVSG